MNFSRGLNSSGHWSSRGTAWSGSCRSWGLDNAGGDVFIDAADALTAIDSVVAVLAPARSPRVLDFPVGSWVTMAPRGVSLDAVTD